MGEKILYEMDLENTQEGFVYPGFSEKDDRLCFKNWKELKSAKEDDFYLTPFRVMDDEGTYVLDYSICKFASLVCAGDGLLDNYTVTADLRHMKQGVDGIAFRIQDAANFYLFGYNSYKDLRLWKVIDGEWVVLAAVYEPIDDYRYYKMEAIVCGSRIVCRIYDETVFDLIDTSFPRGMAGGFFGGRARCKNIKICR
jgi:hypothetical protein